MSNSEKLKHFSNSAFFSIFLLWSRQKKRELHALRYLHEYIVYGSIYFILTCQPIGQRCPDKGGSSIELNRFLKIGGKLGNHSVSSYVR